MTVVCTDGIVMASDTMSLFGDERCVRRAQKIFVEQGCIFGMCGSNGMYAAVIKWFLAGAGPKDVPPKFESQGWGMLVARGGRLYYLTSEVPYACEVEAPFAIGSGERVAIVAMRCGKTPVEAAALAIEMLNTCGGDVDVVDIKASPGANFSIAAE